MLYKQKLSKEIVGLKPAAVALTLGFLIGANAFGAEFTCARQSGAHEEVRETFRFQEQTDRYNFEFLMGVVEHGNPMPEFKRFLKNEFGLVNPFDKYQLSFSIKKLEGQEENCRFSENTAPFYCAGTDYSEAPHLAQFTLKNTVTNEVLTKSYDAHIN